LKLGCAARKLASWISLRAYLWGIETKSSFLNLLSQQRVASLPMRNWNSNQVWVITNGSYVASLPMRNWNYVISNTVKSPMYVASLPMRNWNEMKEKREKNEGWVASLPMRNWNFKILFKLFKLFLCCEPTYEELKPSGSSTSLVIIPVASLPMRNWNSCILLSLYLEVLRCEPTYEELKHLCKLANSSTTIKLRAYLWGIETLKLCIKLPIHMGCEPTYEELKLDLGMKISKC